MTQLHCAMPVSHAVTGNAVLKQIIEGVLMRSVSYVIEVEGFFRIWGSSLICYFFKFYVEHFLEGH